MKNDSYRTKKQNINTAKGRSNSSVNWLRRHINDPYVQKAKQLGLVSRAAFKLMDIDAKFKLIHRANSIVDLGAAPGSWLQTIDRIRKPNTCVVGIDLQEVAMNLPNVSLLKGDFLDEEMQDAIISLLKSKPDLIVSDMAASASGDRNLDHLRSSELIRSVLEFAEKNLQVRGNLVIKSIRGGEESKLILESKRLFSVVKMFKPEASYSDSAEVYIVCLNRMQKDV